MQDRETDALVEQGIALNNISYIANTLQRWAIKADALWGKQADPYIDYVREELEKLNAEHQRLLAARKILAELSAASMQHDTRETSKEAA